VPFGAFVRVDDGIEGLVHISELAERHVDIPEQVVSVGEEITVKVIDIDLDRRRISLSLKQALQDQQQVVQSEDELALEEGGYEGYEGYEGYGEGDYAQGYYDEQGNLIGVVPGTAMAEAFQEAGFYDATYGEGEEGAEEQATDEQQQQQDESAESGAEAAQGQDTLENIVEDLKRKNSNE